MSSLKPEALRSAIRNCTTGRDTDMFSYSGPIYPDEVNRFITFALERVRRKNVGLILTTYGGDADAAYRLARYLQGFYDHVRLYVIGPCKSAGTLVTLCADEMVFGPFGELGPLDMQVAKKDDLVSMVSGLDTFQALSIIRSYAFEAFEGYMYKIVEDSGGAISTQTAGEFAAQLVAGLFQPLSAQLDPQRMGEVQRLVDIAKAYGERLSRKNLKDGALRKLIEGYPSHTFIIDFLEASTLFKKVEKISADEMAVIWALQRAGACVTHPSRTIVLNDVATLFPEGQESEHEASRRSPEDPGADGQRESEPLPETPGNGSRAAARHRRKGPLPALAVADPDGSRDAQV